MSQAFPMLLHFVAGIFGAFGQYYYKRGGVRLATTPLLENWQILVGVLCFCAVMVLFVFSYKAGGRISAVYPFYATTFLWGALIGKFLDGEPLNATVVAGTLLILLGVTVVGLGARG